MGKIINFYENEDGISKKDIEDSIESILYILEQISEMSQLSCVSEEMGKSVDKIYGILFPNSKNKEYDEDGFLYLPNDRMKNGIEIVTIDKVINDYYNAITNMLSSSTYACNGFDSDRADDNYMKLLTNEIIEDINAIVSSTIADTGKLSRSDIRIKNLRERLKNIIQKAKLEGIIPFDFNDSSLDGVIEYISSNYYELNFAVIERLFNDTLKDTSIISYAKYDIERRKNNLCLSLNNARNDISLYLNEEAYQEFEKINEFVVNSNDIKLLNFIESLIQFFVKLKSIRYEYSDLSDLVKKIDVWRELFLKLMQRVTLLISENKDNDYDNLLEEINQYYLSLRNEYCTQLFDKDLDPNTQKVNLTLCRNKKE